MKIRTKITSIAITLCLICSGLVAFGAGVGITDSLIQLPGMLQPQTLGVYLSSLGPGGLSNMIAGQLGVAGSPNTITSSVPVGATGINTVPITDSAGHINGGVLPPIFPSGLTIPGATLPSPTINGTPSITGLQNPVNAPDAVNKAYADAIAAGTIYHAPVAVATSAILPNSPVAAGSGVGKTLTAGSNAALVIGSYTVLLNDRVLVQNQATASDNGIYQQTTLGSGSVKWVLTRAADFNTATGGNVALGATVLTLNAGGAPANTLWALGAPTPTTIVVDTTALSFNQVSASSANITGMTSGQLAEANSATTINASVPFSNSGAASSLVQTNGAGLVAQSVIPTGTSGATLGLLSASKTDSGNNTYSGSNVYLGSNSAGVCPLTDATSITSSAAACANDATKGVAVNKITLTATGHTLALPTGLPSAGGQSITYQITHSGNDGPVLGTGFVLAGGAQPPECNGSSITSNCWSTTSGLTDWLSCLSIDGTHVGCGPPITNMAAPAGATFIQAASAGSVSSVSTLTATFGAAVGAGHIVACDVSWTSVANALSTLKNGSGTSYTLVDTATTTGGAVFQAEDGWLLDSAGGSSTVIATFTSSVPQVVMVCGEFSGPTTLGVHAIQQQTSLNPGTDVATSTSVTTSTPSLVVGLGVNGGVSSVIAGSGFTLRTSSTIAGNDWAGLESLQQSAAGAQAATFSPNNGDNWVTAIMTFH